MLLSESPQVSEKFDRYPEPIQNRLLFLRRLILETAAETESVGKVEETLKWGQPSYLSKTGSTIRIDWDASTPQQYMMYFHCSSRLIDTFKELYRNRLVFEGNRAIVFKVDEEIPIDAIKSCITLALTYHLRKHLPMLGV